jgi:hypothetical protein
MTIAAPAFSADRGLRLPDSPAVRQLAHVSGSTDEGLRTSESPNVPDSGVEAHAGAHADHERDYRERVRRPRHAQSVSLHAMASPWRKMKMRGIG